MSQLKKIDYRKLEGASQQTEQAQGSVETDEKKESCFGSLKTRWDMTNKTIKIEIIVLSVVIIAIVASLIIYFVNKESAYKPSEFYGEPDTENVILSEEKLIDF